MRIYQSHIVTRSLPAFSINWASYRKSEPLSTPNPSVPSWSGNRFFVQEDIVLGMKSLMTVPISGSLSISMWPPDCLTKT